MSMRYLLCLNFDFWAWSREGTGWLECFSALTSLYWTIWLIAICAGMSSPSPAGHLDPRVWIPAFLGLLIMHSLAMSGNAKVFRFWASTVAMFIWIFCGVFSILAVPLSFGGYYWLMLGAMMGGVAYHGRASI